MRGRVEGLPSAQKALDEAALAGLSGGHGRGKVDAPLLQGCVSVLQGGLTAVGGMDVARSERTSGLSPLELGVVDGESRAAIAGRGGSTTRFRLHLGLSGRLDGKGTVR